MCHLRPQPGVRVRGFAACRGRQNGATRIPSRNAAFGAQQPWRLSPCWHHASYQGDGDRAGGVLQYKGEIKLNEFASANDNDEYEWSITIEGKGKHHDRMKKLILQARTTARAHGHSQTLCWGREVHQRKSLQLYASSPGLDVALGRSTHTYRSARTS